MPLNGNAGWMMSRPVRDHHAMKDSTPSKYPAHRYRYLLQNFDQIPLLRRERREWYDNVIAWNRNFRLFLNELAVGWCVLIAVQCLCAPPPGSVARMLCLVFSSMAVLVWLPVYWRVHRIHRELEADRDREQEMLRQLTDDRERHRAYMEWLQEKDTDGPSQAER